MVLLISNKFHIGSAPSYSTTTLNNPKSLVSKIGKSNNILITKPRIFPIVKCVQYIERVTNVEDGNNVSQDGGLGLISRKPLPKSDLKRDDFPANFLFGASTSALQTEGPGDEGGRGPSSWDSMIEADKGMKATDSYHLYKEDVKLLKQMGMNAYRFSISWSRLLPNGTLESGVNQEGIDFYNNLIDELLANGITPVVTLFHFDMPQVLQEQFEGFLSSDIINLFKEYADLCFKEFGDRVKIWGTINEPLIYVYLRKDKDAKFPPDLQGHPLAPYIKYHNIILAHATVAKYYKQHYQKNQGGQIGISLPIQWSMPYSRDDPIDVAATDASLDLAVGWFMDPLVHGDYPHWMRMNVKGLPHFTHEQRELVKNSFDFIGINYYTARYINQTFDYDALTGRTTITFMPETANTEGKGLGWQAQGRDDIYNYPDGLKELLLHMKHKYGNPPIYVTENGVSSKPTITSSVDDMMKEGKIKELQAALNDDERVDYAAGHVKAVHEAWRAGANVKGYIVWALMDNMEVGNGYNVRFGLNYVDYYDNCKRYAKRSAKWFTNFLQSTSEKVQSENLVQSSAN